LCVLTNAKRPDWDRLFEVAAAQSGYFTTKQAAEAGYSTYLLRKHIHAGRVTRPQRGIYRLVHCEAMAREDQLAWAMLEEVTNAARAFLDPVLVDAHAATWDPTSWMWRTHG
jgi:hypothetical protein